MNQLYLYLGIYIFVLLGFSYWVSRKQDDEDFFISGRNRPGWQVFASKFAASIGAAYFITYTGFAYEFGLGTMTLIIGAIIAYPIFAFWAAPRIYKDATKQRFYTIGDFVYSKIKSKFASNLTNFFSIAMMFAWLLTGIIGGGKIISDFGILSYNFAVFLTALVVLTYILMAGYKAVILTDIIQSIIIFVLLFVVTFGIIGSTSISHILATETANIDIGVALGFLIYGILAVFSSADRYQLSYASKNEKNLKHGLAWVIVPLLIATFLLLFVGLFVASQVPGIDPALAFTEGLRSFLPSSLLPLAVVLFFAGIMSSADTNIYAISSHYALSGKKKSRKLIRNATVLLVIIITIMALIFPDIIGVSVIAGMLTLVAATPMVYIIAGGSNKNRFISSIIGSLIGMAIGIALFGISPTVALPMILCSCLGLLWKGKN